MKLVYRYSLNSYRRYVEFASTRTHWVGRTPTNAGVPKCYRLNTWRKHFLSTVHRCTRSPSINQELTIDWRTYLDGRARVKGARCEKGESSRVISTQRGVQSAHKAPRLYADAATRLLAENAAARVCIYPSF